CACPLSLTLSCASPLLSSFVHLPSVHFFFLFFLSPPPPPSSTLFPYTTLFRSVSMDVIFPISFCQKENGVYHLKRLYRSLPSTIDRKSTRLNSSHVSISYAVFCLKKKKKEIIVLCLNYEIV